MFSQVILFDFPIQTPTDEPRASSACLPKRTKSTRVLAPLLKPPHSGSIGEKASGLTEANRPFAGRRRAYEWLENGVKQSRGICVCDVEMYTLRGVVNFSAVGGLEM